MSRIAILFLVIAAAAPLAWGDVGAEKVIIAHRGACGYLPEHTLASYAMAYAMGADYIEQDLAMTSDHVLICLHDTTLDATTDVAAVFPDRKRADGKYDPADFTLEEIRRLHTRERLPKRFPREARLFQIPTFEEAIQLVQGLNASTGRTVGIYPELKDPSFYKEQNLPFVETLLEVLSKYGYEGPKAPIFIQCFSPSALLYLREELKTTLPLMQLISDNEMLNSQGYEKIAGYAQAIGPDKKCLELDPVIVEKAHAAGLKVHPYTFRAEFVPRKYTNVEEEMRVFLFEYGIDGGFIDQPDKMKAVRDAHK